MSKQERKQQRHLERAQEDVQRALGRRDGGEAAEHLLLLPRDQRDALLPQVAVAFGAEVRNAYGARDLGRLQRLAARADSEPRLLGAGQQQDREVMFALCLTALRVREWPRAERLLALLADTLAARSPKLLAWLQAFLLHRGQIPAEVAVTLAPLPALAPDPRLGYDAVAKPVRLTPPQKEEDLEPTIAALFARETAARRLWDTLSNWQRDLAEPLRPRLAIVAAPYLVRAALQARRAGQSQSALNPLLLALAEIIRGAPPEILPDITLALRLVSMGLPADPEAVAPPELMRLLLGMARVCIGYEELRPTLAELLLRTLIHRDSAAQALGLLETLLPGLAAGPTRGALQVKALQLWALSQILPGMEVDQLDTRLRAPAWLVQELSAAIKDESLLTHLAQVEQSDFKRLRTFLQLSSSALPMELCESLVPALLPRLEEQGRRELASFLMALCDRANEISDDEAIKWARQNGKNPARATARDLIELAEDLDEEMPPEYILSMMFQGERLPPELHATFAQMLWRAEAEENSTPLAKRLINQYGLPLLPYQPQLLDFLLDEAPDVAAKRAVLERYLADQSRIDDYMDLLDRLHSESESPGLYKDLILRMLTTFSNDGSALAKAFLRTVGQQLGETLIMALAMGVCGTHKEGKLPPGADNDRALRLAQRLVPKPPKSKKTAPAKSKKAAPAPGKKKAPAKAKTAAAPAKKAAPAPGKKAPGKKTKEYL